MASSLMCNGASLLADPQWLLYCLSFLTSCSWQKWKWHWFVFFDLRKAFDNVPHRPLLEKLEETGLNLHLLQWIANYLCGCYQYAVVDRESSPMTKVLSGVPQGSVLGPLLFLIYTNSLSSLLLTSGSSLVLCADDILLYKPISCQADS